MNKYLSIMTLNVNGLNAPVRRHREAEWIKNMTHTYAAYKRLTSEQKNYQTESEGLERNILSKQMGKKSWGSSTYIRGNRFLNKGHKKTQRTPHNSKGKNPSRR